MLALSNQKHFKQAQFGQYKFGNCSISYFNPVCEHWESLSVDYTEHDVLKLFELEYHYEFQFCCFNSHFFHSLHHPVVLRSV